MSETLCPGTGTETWGPDNPEDGGPMQRCPVCGQTVPVKDKGDGDGYFASHPAACLTGHIGG